MTRMFTDAAAFNQNLSNWCVSLIFSRPVDFAGNSPLQTIHEPVWGTCPLPILPPVGLKKGNEAAASAWYTYRQYDDLYLRLPALGEGQQHQVAIFSLSGQQVARFSTNQTQVQILANVPSGVYLISLEGEIQRVMK
jgi:hypothetical protein